MPVFLAVEEALKSRKESPNHRVLEKEMSVMDGVQSSRIRSHESRESLSLSLSIAS